MRDLLRPHPFQLDSHVSLKARLAKVLRAHSKSLCLDLTDAADRATLNATGIESAILDLCEQDKQDNSQLDERMRLSLYSAVANLIGDVEGHPRLTLLKINIEVVDSLVEVLRQALDNKVGGQPWESMQALANLAIADDNKALICERCLGLAVDVLSKGSTEPQLELYTCKLLAQLALHQDKLSLIQERREALAAVFERLETQGQVDGTRRAAAVGRFQVAGTTISKQEQDSLKASMQQGHIMLS